MTKDKNLAVQFLINIAVWALFCILPLIFLPTIPRLTTLQSPLFVWPLVGMLLAFYYFNYYWLIPKTLARKRILLYISLVLLCLIVYLVVLYANFLFSDSTQESLKKEAERALQKGFKKRPPKKLPYLFITTGPIIMFLLAFIISGGSKILSEWFYAEQIKEAIGKQQLQTELSLLKSQVNPHFLFNTLNSIYTLSLTHSDKAPVAVLKLSKIMRYTLEESQNDEVALTDEIDFIRNYIDLQKMRLTENVSINFATEGPVESVVIAPLLFIPFIENAFKYGISTHRPSSIDIKISVTDQELIFTCNNDIISSSIQGGTGTGITNTKRRMELLYPERHQLTIEKNEQFNVLLTINLK